MIKLTILHYKLYMGTLQYHPNLFLNLNELIVITPTPNTNSAPIWGQSVSIPTPFKNIPLIITRKYLSGFK